METFRQWGITSLAVGRSAGISSGVAVGDAGHLSIVLTLPQSLS